MICGLNKWEEALDERSLETDIDYAALTIHEPRLEKFLRVQSFRRPFPFKSEGSTNKYLRIPAVFFPRWHYCSSCGKMHQIPLTHSDERLMCDPNKKSCQGFLIPVRFVAACQLGHIQDVPFMEWVHEGEIDFSKVQHNLTYKSGTGSGDLSSIRIVCSCGRSRSLAGIMNETALANIGKRSSEQTDINQEENERNPLGQYCQGHRPWLGPEGINPDRSCGQQLRVLIRGGSNVQYAKLLSALYLPGYGETVDPKIGKILEKLNIGQLKKLYEQNGDKTLIKTILNMREEVEQELIDLDDLTEEVISSFSESDQEEELLSETDLRFQEYSYILEGRSSENADFKATVKDFSDYQEKELLSGFFEKVVLVEKLRETRIFTGFSRINAEDGRSREERIRDLSLNPVDWLPAHIVYGEGIFLQFNEKRLEEWVNRYSAGVNQQIERYHLSRQKRLGEKPYETRDLNPAFIMMHTMAHLLIKRLCFNCGYGSSSLRERIYFSTQQETKMNGILIYTSSGDSEGSMGGLVRQGKEKFLGPLIREAIEDARWCSADPVCSDIGRTAGQGPDSLNGSACHNCAILPETSCEEFNVLLDRSTIVNESFPTLRGYFEDI